jgi:excisionase family DNA binding protein
LLDSAIREMGGSPQLSEALAAFSESIRTGTDVMLAQVDDDLSPTKAAQILRMSRTHLYKLIKSGDVKATRVGSDWRIGGSEVERFQRARDEESRKFAERAARMSALRSQVLGALE